MYLSSFAGQPTGVTRVRWQDSKCTVQSTSNRAALSACSPSYLHMRSECVLLPLSLVNCPIQLNMEGMTQDFQGPFTEGTWLLVRLTLKKQSHTV